MLNYIKHALNRARAVPESVLGRCWRIPLTETRSVAKSKMNRKMRCGGPILILSELDEVTRTALFLLGEIADRAVALLPGRPWCACSQFREPCKHWSFAPSVLSPTPVSAESLPVPLDHGCRLDQHHH